jgi:hypothetical protein
LVVIAATRFARTGQLLDDQEMHSVGGVRAELLLSAALALIVAGFSTYLALDPMSGWFGICTGNGAISNVTCGRCLGDGFGRAIFEPSTATSEPRERSRHL